MRKKYIVEISKSDSKVALAELDARGKVIDVDYENGLAIVKLPDEFVYDGYGFVKRISQLYESLDLLVLNIRDDFKVFGFDALKFADLIYEKTKKRVNVNNPKQKVFVYKFKGSIIYGIELIKLNSNYLNNRNRILCVSSATVLNARIARAMFNLINADKDDIILDPFCGAGGILIESRWNIIGNDKFIDALAKAKMNKVWFRKDYLLINSDAMKIEKIINEFKVTKIVTDFPYGLRSKIERTLKELLEIVLKQRLPTCFLIIKKREIDELIWSLINKYNFGLRFTYDFYVRKDFYRRLYCIFPEF